MKMIKKSHNNNIMKFYSVVEKRPVEVKDYKIVKTKNNRFLAVGDYKGSKVYKFIKAPTK